MSQRTIQIACIILILMAGFAWYHKQTKTPVGSDPNPVNVSECVRGYQNVTVQSQNQDGNSCSITLSNGTTQVLTCDQLPNYPVSSEITLSVCK